MVDSYKQLCIIGFKLSNATERRESDMASRAEEIKKHTEGNQVDAFSESVKEECYTAHNEGVKSLTNKINNLISEISSFDLDDKVSIINGVRGMLA